MNRERIIRAIKEIAASPKNVRFDELVNLLDNHIKPMIPNYNHHGNAHHSFTVGENTFTIPKPHTGCVKDVYVKQFLQAMEDVELYTTE